MIRPPRGSCAFITRNAACVHRNIPVRFTATMDCQSSNGRSSRGTGGSARPALLNSTSTRPSSCSARSNSCCTPAGSVTSVATASRREPSAAPSATVCSSGPGRRPAITTEYPSRPRARADARPMPVPPPVTIATLPVMGRNVAPADPESSSASACWIEGSGAARSGSEEGGSEEQLGPGRIGQLFLHGCANRLPRTAHEPLVYGGERPHSCGAELRYPPSRVAGNLEIQHDPAAALGKGLGALGDDVCALGHLRQGVRRQDRFDPGREAEAAGVGLHEADIAPAVRLYPILGTGEHRVGQVDAYYPAAGTNQVLEQREVQACATCDVDHGVTPAKAECSYGPEALCPLRVAGRGIEPGGDVVVLRLLAVGLDQALLGTAGHLGIRAFPHSGLDRSLDRDHLDIAYALNPAFEHPGRDRAHDAREVDLNPHHGVGLPTVRRLEFHSPARRR